MESLYVWYGASIANVCVRAIARSVEWRQKVLAASQRFAPGEIKSGGAWWKLQNPSEQTHQVW